MTLIIGPSCIAALYILHFLVTPTACLFDSNISLPRSVFPVALFPLPVRHTRTMFFISSDILKKGMKRGRI